MMEIWRVANEAVAVYGLSLAICGFGIFAFIVLIVTIIRNWRDLIDE